MRSFASDNNSGVHPRILEAIIRANDNHAVGYGDDPWTGQAVAKLKEVFGQSASPCLTSRNPSFQQHSMCGDGAYKRRRMRSTHTNERMRGNSYRYSGR